MTKNYEMTLKNSLAPFLVCVCVLKKGTKKVLLIYDEKKYQSLNRAPTISAFEA